jgi:hypothetical protein
MDVYSRADVQADNSLELRDEQALKRNKPTDF